MSDGGVRPEVGIKTGSRRSGWVIAFLSGLVGLLIGALAMVLSSGYFVRRYLVENPEVVQEAIEALQQREMANVVRPLRARLETPFHGSWAGAQASPGGEPARAKEQSAPGSLDQDHRPMLGVLADCDLCDAVNVFRVADRVLDLSRLGRVHDLVGEVHCRLLG